MRDRGSRRGGRGRSESRRSSRSRRREERYDDEYDDRDDRFDDDYDDEEEERPRRRRRSSRESERSSRGRGRGRGGRRGGRSGGMDWGAAQDEDRYDDEDDYEEEERPRRPARRSRRKPPKRRRLTLMELCTPVFGCSAMLPRQEGAPDPSYDEFRKEVMTALRRIESEADEHGIEEEDARQATYALSFFMDGSVSQSEWSHKGRWGGEPLGIMLQQDPEGGINFFRRLDGLGDRQGEVREVFLVCLALGYRGKYAELEPTQQAAKLGEIRQKLVRKIHPQTLEKLPELFPEGYEPADAIPDTGPPPAKWWVLASLGIVAACVLLYGLMWMSAGSFPADVNQRLGEELEQIDQMEFEPVQEEVQG